jgi:exonuclease SbcC
MRLLQLKIENFLTYNYEELNIEELKTALILGMHNNNPSESNGSGKSNLLESIGWCLFGKSKADSLDLNVKYDKDSCFVELTFEHNGKTCRINRSRNVKSDSSTLDFFINEVPSNGSKITETQDKIIDFLKLDYNTYINSVYLKQDDIYSLANSKKSSEGRELIESVLSLGDYDVCHEEANNKAKELKQNKEILENKIEQNKDIQSKINEINIQINETNIEIKNKEEKIKELEYDYKVKELKVKELEINSSKLSSLISEKQRLEQEIKDDNKSLENTKQKANEAKTGLENKKIKLENDILKENDIKIEKQQFESDVEKNKLLSNDILNIIKKIELENEKINKINKEIDEIDKNIIELNDKNIEIVKSKAKLSSELNVLNDKNNELKKQEKEITNKIENPTIDDGEVCDKCLNKITSHSIINYKNHLKEKLSTIMVSSNEIDSKIKEVNNSIKLNDEELIDVKTKKNEFDINKNNIKEQIKLIEINKKEIEKSKKEIEDKVLSDKYIKDKLDLINNKFDIIERFKKELLEIDIEKELVYWKDIVKEQKKTINNKNERIIAIDSDIMSIPSDDNKIKEEFIILKDNLDKEKAIYHTLKANVKNLEEKIKEFDIIFTRYKNDINELNELNENLTTYKELVTAFSSSGIKAKILTKAIEELEEESNSMLKKLTDGRLSIEFKTEKELKNKSEKTVFEVHVKDGDKILPFNQYSGGEKFRISFVLRIALSKLLLKRANSKLEFLIIDEAISPLDENGIEGVLQIIRELQEEFKTILIITHRVDVKKHFDQIINVYRDSDGSKILK